MSTRGLVHGQPDGGGRSVQPSTDPPAPDLRGRLLRDGYRNLLRPAMFSVAGGDAETVHERTLVALRLMGAVPPLRAAARSVVGGPRHPVTVAGISFPGRVGLAAGMDKDARAAQAWAGLGFGFVELGTVTARPQPGNARPRLYRLPASGALVNRMGFNNRGAQEMAHRLARLGVARGAGSLGLPVGISIGKSRSAHLDEAVGDYLRSFRLLAPYADYVAVNVSSPNTPGLRSLQDAAALTGLLTALVGAARSEAAIWNRPDGPVPIFVKIAPDLTFDAIDELLDVCTRAGANGLIATNTTLSRDGLDPADRAIGEETGGLSGAPLTHRARAVVQHLTARTTLPVIGVGGIMTPADAAAMFDAGAALVQLYTGFVYAGPALVHGINAIDPAGHPSRS